VFSPERWTLVGEAAGFLDAFYSPGSDYIAYTNTWSGELIKRELDGEDVSELADFYNEFFINLFNTTCHLYRDNYQLFGNPQVMTAKFTFDSLTYFTVLGSPFIHNRFTTREDLELLGPIVEDAIELLPRMQQLFRDWHALGNTAYEGVSVLSKQFVPYIEAQRDMAREASDEEFVARTRKNLETLKAYAVWVFFKAAKSLPEQPDESRPIDPLKMTLSPERWEPDGLYSETGITLAQARELLVGVEEMDLEAQGAVVTA
jgi:hypothetical protein